MGHKNNFEKCCKPAANKGHCGNPESFLLHQKTIKPGCGLCIDKVKGCAWGAAQALWDPSEGPCGTVKFVGYAHRLCGGLAHDGAVQIKVHFLDCQKSLWCTFEASQYGTDFDDCNNETGRWVTFSHECIVPNEEIKNALACGRALLSVVTDDATDLEPPAAPSYTDDCDSGHGGETGEVRGIVCLQELCNPKQYKDVKCRPERGPDTCLPYSCQPGDAYPEDASSSYAAPKKGGRRGGSSNKGGCGCGSKWF